MWCADRVQEGLALQWSHAARVLDPPPIGGERMIVSALFRLLGMTTTIVPVLADARAPEMMSSASPAAISMPLPMAALPDAALPAVRPITPPRQPRAPPHPSSTPPLLPTTWRRQHRSILPPAWPDSSTVTHRPDVVACCTAESTHDGTGVLQRSALASSPDGFRFPPCLRWWSPPVQPSTPLPSTISPEFTFVFAHSTWGFTTSSPPLSILLETPCDGDEGLDFRVPIATFNSASPSQEVYFILGSSPPSEPALFVLPNAVSRMVGDGSDACTPPVLAMPCSTPNFSLPFVVCPGTTACI